MKLNGPAVNRVPVPGVAKTRLAGVPREIIFVAGHVNKPARRWPVAAFPSRELLAIQRREPVFVAREKNRVAVEKNRPRWNFGLRSALNRKRGTRSRRAR